MSKAAVKLLYRQVIHSDSKSSLEKSMWKASYEEFLLKSQAYNPEGKYTSFRQMIDSDGRANSLHYKAGFAVASHVETLQKKIPQLTDSLERKIDFETFECKVIDSDITRPEVHAIAVHYITGYLIYYGSVGSYMLLSKEEFINNTASAETFMLEMQPNLSIILYKLL